MITYRVYCVYGIEVIRDGISEVRSEALFDDPYEAKEYAERFTRLELSPIHLNDVICDIKADKRLKLPL